MSLERVFYEFKHKNHSKWLSYISPCLLNVNYKYFYELNYKYRMTMKNKRLLQVLVSILVTFGWTYEVSPPRALSIHCGSALHQKVNSYKRIKKYRKLNPLWNLTTESTSTNIESISKENCNRKRWRRDNIVMMMKNERTPII